MAAAPAEVIVDDRLATVLATVPASHEGARTQYRQLLDLLGRAPPGFALPAPAEARLDELEARLNADERAEMIRALSGSLRHPALILRLSRQAPTIAASAVVSARLDDWQWSALAIELPLSARGYLRQRRDLGPRTEALLARLGIGELGLPSPPGDMAPPPPAPVEGAAGIAAIVRRIEAFRRTRRAGSRQLEEGRASFDSAPPLPFADLAGEPAPAPVAIEFITDAAGRIVSASQPFTAMLFGVRLGPAQRDGVALSDKQSAKAFAQRRPVRGGRLTLVGAPAIAGAWRIDAAPRFAAFDGIFLGFTGVLRRPPVDIEGSAADSPADRLRQLLHELRTPVNAIQGFAELIQQQLFGPTPHQYRSLAASIASDSAAILAGFEEIDRLVRLETGRGELAVGTCNVVAVIERLLRQIELALTERDAAFTFATGSIGAVAVAVAESEAERMLWRVLAHIAAATVGGERLELELTAGKPRTLRIDLPAALAEVDDDALFAVAPTSDGPALGLLGGGFPLRLARAEAEAHGGGIEREGRHLLIHFPGLTPTGAIHSPADRMPGASAGEG